MKIREIFEDASGAGGASAGGTSAGMVAVNSAYPNKPAKTPKNKNGTAKNALDLKGANLITGGSLLKR
jgi:hypothetical protein